MPQTTIAAISTPLFNGGIGIVRLSGPQALEIAARVFYAKSGISLQQMHGYTAALGRVFYEEGDLDDCIATVYRAPKSYTGEDVVELSCHGGVFLLKTLLRLCLKAGAVLAGPGEFTKRAFLNGKMNMAQAEAVMDLISAQNEQAARMALSGRDGVLSEQINKVAGKLTDLAGHIAAWIDYPEEDVPELSSESLILKLGEVQTALGKLIQSYEKGQLVKQGVQTAIVGRPNVGKSTLMNLLLGYERSIVTEIPGTTRDVIEASAMIGDIQLNLSDTAGIRATEDVVEALGVHRSLGCIETAQLILAVFDTSRPLDEEDKLVIQKIKGLTALAVLNKADLPAQLDLEYINRHFAHTVTLSASNPQELEKLQTALKQLLQLSSFDPTAPLIANERQRQCVLAALSAVQQALEAVMQGISLDAVGVLIDEALTALYSLTGQSVSEQVVENVFARFCVGK